jgi:hypothetical protein
MQLDNYTINKRLEDPEIMEAILIVGLLEVYGGDITSEIALTDLQRDAAKISELIKEHNTSGFFT